MTPRNDVTPFEQNHWTLSGDYHQASLSTAYAGSPDELLTLAFDLNSGNSGPLLVGQRAYEIDVQFVGSALVWGPIQHFLAHGLFIRVLAGIAYHSVLSSSPTYTPDLGWDQNAPPGGQICYFGGIDNATGVNPATGACWTYADLQTGQFGVDEYDFNWGGAPTSFSLSPTLEVTAWGYPSITSLDVVSGPTAGGTVVNITGVEFRGNHLANPLVLSAVQVLFGGTLCSGTVMFFGTPYSNPLSITDLLILCATPPHIAGVVDVVVRCYYADGSTEDATLVNGYTYVGVSPVIVGSGGLGVSGDLAPGGGGGFDLRGLQLQVSGGNSGGGGGGGGTGVPATSDGCIVAVTTAADGSDTPGCPAPGSPGADSGGGSGCGVSL